MPLFGSKYKNTKSKQKRSAALRPAATSTAPAHPHGAVVSHSYVPRASAHQASIQHVPTAQPVENQGYTMRRSMRGAPQHSHRLSLHKRTPQPAPPHTQRPVISQSAHHNPVQPWMGAVTLPADKEGPAMKHTTMRPRPAPGAIATRHDTREGPVSQPKGHPHYSGVTPSARPSRPSSADNTSVEGGWSHPETNKSLWNMFTDYFLGTHEPTTPGRDSWDEEDVAPYEDIKPARAPSKKMIKGKKPAFENEVRPIVRTLAAMQNRANQWGEMEGYPRHEQGTCHYSTECRAEVARWEYEHPMYLMVGEVGMPLSPMPTRPGYVRPQ